MNVDQIKDEKAEDNHIELIDEITPADGSRPASQLTD